MPQMVALACIFGVAVNLLFNPPRGEAVAATATLKAAVTFADAGPETAQRGTVASPPAPDAVIGGIGGAQTTAAGLAQEDAVGTAANGGGDER